MYYWIHSVELISVRSNIQIKRLDNKFKWKSHFCSGMWVRSRLHIEICITLFTYTSAGHANCLIACSGHGLAYFLRLRFTFWTKDKEMFFHNFAWPHLTSFPLYRYYSMYFQRKIYVDGKIGTYISYPVFIFEWQFYVDVEYYEITLFCRNERL